MPIVLIGLEFRSHDYSDLEQELIVKWNEGNKKKGEKRTEAEISLLKKYNTRKVLGKSIPEVL